jgi:hypothetical protein
VTGVELRTAAGGAGTPSRGGSNYADLLAQVRQARGETALAAASGRPHAGRPAVTPVPAPCRHHDDGHEYVMQPVPVLTEGPLCAGRCLDEP